MGLLILVLSGCGTRNDPAPVYGLAAPAPPGYYRIRYGDTLSEIAARQGLPMEVLASWNDLAPPYRILAGGLLRIVPPPRQTAPDGPSSRASTRQASVHHGSSVATPDVTRAAPSVPTGRRATPEIAWQWPVSGGLLRTFDAKDRTRQGIRIAARAGQFVVAAAPGKVVYSGGGLKGHGNLIIIEHEGRYLSAYAFSQRLLVEKDTWVKGGQRIAEIGPASGRGQPQLHFEIRRDGAAVDPLDYLPAARR